MIEIIEADREELVAEAARLFAEYARGQPDELCLAGFESELAEMDRLYTPPEGRLLLARVEDRIAGCVALCAGEGGEGEIRRLYVRDFARGKGIGRRLARAVLDAARGAGYGKVLLTTRAHMAEAIALYGSLGFAVVDPPAGESDGERIWMAMTLPAAAMPQPAAVAEVGGDR